MRKRFEEWIKRFELTPMDSAEKQTYAYEDMREAFEEGYHIAKDEGIRQLESIFIS